MTAAPAIAAVHLSQAGVTAHAAPTASAAVSEYKIPTPSSAPTSITSGPNGTLWFTESSGNKIGRITQAGKITEFGLPTAGSQPQAITTGPDGNLWFTETAHNAIGRITPKGVITEFTIPTASSGPWGITSGPDGNLWFTEQSAGNVARLTTGGTFTEFSSGACALGNIIKGPDSNLWAVDLCGQAVRVTIGGSASVFNFGCCPNDIASGPDGNVWFADGDHNTGQGVALKMSTSGSGVTKFPTPTASSTTPQGITAGPNGAMWMTDSGDQIVESSTAGAMTDFPLPTSGAGATAITSGPDGNVWFVENGGNAIGKLVIPGTCANFSADVSHANVGPGVQETVNLTVQNCGTTTISGASTATTVTPPGSCGAAPAITELSSDVGPGGSATSSTSFAAPSCLGTYTVSSQATDHQGYGSPLGSASTSYTVAYGAVVEHPTDARPQAIVAGPDGNLWYTRGQGSGSSGSDIASLTPTGVETVHPSPIPYPQAIAAGPDGNIWVGDFNYIASITTSGSLVTQTLLPSHASYPFVGSMVTGPDGNLWFTESIYGGTGKIGRVTTGGSIKEFGGLPDATNPGDIAAGPDGNVWFTLNDQVGKITPQGAITVYPLPAGDSVSYITLGPDGNLWFLGSNSSGGLVGAMTTGGTVVHQYTTPQSSGLYGIVQGADGKLWFNEEAAGKVTSVTPGGTFNEVPVYAAGNAQHLAAGPDGNIWISEYYGFSIGQVGIAPPSACTPVHTASNPSSVPGGQQETLTTKIRNCANTPALLKVATKTTPPSGCGTATTTTVTVPLTPHARTTETSTFTAPSCAGTYTVKTTLSVGGTNVGSSTTTYQVT